MTASDYREMIHSIVVPGNLSYDEKRKRYQPIIDFLNTDVPQKLYRFRDCEERKIREFEQDMLGFAPAYKMNDDFDGMLYFDKAQILNGLESLTPDMIHEHLRLAKQGLVPSGIKNLTSRVGFNSFANSLLSLSTDKTNSMITQFRDFVTEDFDNRMLFLNGITRYIRIACLTSDIESPSMWGYYAKGSGFAVSYDFRGDRITDYCLLPVIYGDERLNATEYAKWIFQMQTIQRMVKDDNVCSMLQQSIPCPDEFMAGKILLHKASNWSPEKEWRLIYYATDGSTEEYPHVTKRPTALYLGRHIDCRDKNRLCGIAEKNHIPVYQMTLREDDPTYKLHPQAI